jgi:hypothetical protein
MSVMASAVVDRTSKRIILESVILFALLAVVILYGVKSWRTYFFIGLADHWDPRLMGEWMAWNANNIIHGHFLVPRYSANFFYPHSYSLAFSELLWPESFFYALFYALSSNPFFTFNATMLFFWALSGILLFVLLRTLGVPVAVSALGSAVYCLMPYRMPYYVEFNMVLIFIFPLMLLVLIRWLKKPTYANALWFCGGYFVAATSCLYYTIMSIIIMMFVAIAFLAADRSLWWNRQFYLSGSLLVVGVFTVTCVYLYPYAIMRFQGGYQRTTADYLKYFAQPMQYLDTSCAEFSKWAKIPQPRFAETFLFPGTVLSILFVSYLIHKATRFLHSFGSLVSIFRYLPICKVVLWVVFWSVILLHAYWGPIKWLQPFDRYLYHIAILLVLLYVIGLFFPRKEAPTHELLLAGLSAAAIVCFFVSFGPFISVGPDSDQQVLARGPFLDLASWNPLFGAVRVLTRFSIVILTYLTIAGCLGFQYLQQKRRMVVWLLPVLMVLLVHEARAMIHYKFYEGTRTLHSHVIKRAQNLPGKYVLLGVPFGLRPAEGDFSLATIGTFPLLINGFSGFAPDYYTQNFGWDNGGWKVQHALPWVTNLWPQAYLLIDQGWLALLEKGWRKPFPWDAIEKNWDLIDKDHDFALYRQKPEIYTSSPIVRLVRTDLLKSYPILMFKAHADHGTSTTLRILLNHKIVQDELQIDEQWKDYSILLPFEDMGNIEGEEINIQVVSTSHIPAQWQIKDIDFKSSK